jgi:hypothetical protein
MKDILRKNDHEIKNVSERFSNLTEFDTKGETTVFFASGSKSISAESQSSLRDLVQCGGSHRLPLRSKSVCRFDRKCIHEPETQDAPRAGGCRFRDPELQRPGQAHLSARRDGDSRTSRFQRNLGRTIAEPTRRGQSSGKPRPCRIDATFTPPARVEDLSADDGSHWSCDRRLCHRQPELSSNSTNESNRFKSADTPPRPQVDRETNASEWMEK